MQFDIVTVLPEYFDGPLAVGVLGRARAGGLLVVRVHPLREFAEDRHRKVDDVPFGGGGGMVLKPEPLIRAVETIRERHPADPSCTILLSPQGRRLDQSLAEALASYRRLVLICGRYEGVDERVIEHCVEREVSVGDYILSGGEAGALVLLEAVGRLLPGVLGSGASVARDSFTAGLLDAPRYTRPEEFRGLRVPEVLLSGDHARIESWRRERALDSTRRKRPDLLETGEAGRGKAPRRAASPRIPS
ncbi:MAG: tRNA (guanosine(37)-N1)-methyltransferase TrmD [Acidobacteria bacterium]|nr:tRNA (guanosine(37)-N1)-methyltransferase TrmD [Acidobacteriota bacterium]